MNQSFGVMFAVCGMLGGQDKALAVLGNSVENAPVIVGDIGVRDSVCPYNLTLNGAILANFFSRISRRLRLISMLSSGLDSQALKR